MSSKPFVNENTSQIAQLAESQFLGAILLLSAGESGGRKEFEESTALLSANDFWTEDHSLIFRAMVSLTQTTSKPLDQIAVAHEITRLTDNKKALCFELSIMVAHCYSPLDYLHYAHEIKEFSDQRHGIPDKPRFKGGITL